MCLELRRAFFSKPSALIKAAKEILVSLVLHVNKCDIIPVLTKDKSYSRENTQQKCFIWLD